MLAPKRLYPFAQVLSDVPTIGDLYRVRIALPNGFAKGGRTITTNNRNGGLLLEPRLDGGNRTVGQEIEDVMGFSIDHNSAKHPPTPKGERIYAHHTRRSHERANAG